MKLNLFRNPLTRSVLIFLGVVLLIRLLGMTSFPDKIFPSVHGFFSKLLFGFSSAFAFSVGDIFYTLLILFGIFLLFRMIFLLFKRSYQKFRNSLSFAICGVAVLYFILYLFWGFNYFKTPIKDSYQTELDSVEELKFLAENYFSKASAYRLKVHENEKGVFISRLGNDELIVEIQQSVLKLDEYSELSFSGFRQPNLKKSLYSEISTYLGISGYYNPFTNESQYNSVNPDSRKIFAQLHETAHQYGFASESEANFVGFLIGLNSENPDLQYVVNFRAMRSLLNRILWYDPEFVKGFIENKYTAGMKRDREFELELDEKYDNVSDDAFALMNEAFLRLNNQEGLQSYGRFVELLVGYHRKYGGLE